MRIPLGVVDEIIIVRQLKPQAHPLRTSSAPLTSPLTALRSAPVSHSRGISPFDLHILGQMPARVRQVGHLICSIIPSRGWSLVVSEIVQHPSDLPPLAPIGTE